MVATPASRVLGIALCAALGLACPGGDANRESELQRVWPLAELVAVELIDDSVAIVVAATGEIHVTRDLGSSWERAHVPAVAGLRSVSMADAETGWAVGEGVILRTDDGGSSWRRQRLPMQAERVRLVSVVALDAQHAIVVGSEGTRLTTRDAGRVWRDVTPAAIERTATAIGFAKVVCDAESKGRCWSVGSGLQDTRDGGGTWRRVEVDDLAQIDPIVFGMGQVEVGPSERARLERFILANRHRRGLIWNLEPGISPRELDQIGRRRDPEALFEVVDARLQELRSLIEELGLPPDPVVQLAEPPWDFADYLDDDPEIVERYWSAREAPQPSVAVRIVADRRLTALRVGSGKLGIAVGRHGALIRSLDRGEHWVMMQPVSPHDLLDVAIGGRRVVAVGAQGGVWLSEDAGSSWNEPAAPAYAPFFEALRAVSFSPSGRTGLIVGEQGRMLRSFDGGADWALLPEAGGG